MTTKKVRDIPVVPLRVKGEMRWVVPDDLNERSKIWLLEFDSEISTSELFNRGLDDLPPFSALPADSYKIIEKD
jgi:hypothetical protein